MRTSYHREWRAKNLDKSRTYSRKSNLKKKYNLTLEAAAALEAKYGYACAICKGKPSGRKRHLDIDHCHTTGTIRGVLCAKCNKLLGLANDSIERLTQVINYLKRFSREN